MPLVQRYHQEIWLQVVCKDEAAVPCHAKQTSPAQSYTTVSLPGDFRPEISWHTPVSAGQFTSVSLLARILCYSTSTGYKYRASSLEWLWSYLWTVLWYHFSTCTVSQSCHFVASHELHNNNLFILQYFPHRVPTFWPGGTYVRVWLLG